MTKINRIIAALFFLLTYNLSFSQNVQGKATYFSKKALRMQLDTLKYDKETRDKISGFFTKQYEKTYELTFNKTESNYKEEIKLGTPTNPSVSKGSNLLYKNLKDKNFIHRKELLGKNFLIKDSIPKYNWEVGSETKKIGDYLCYKATTVINIKVIENKKIKQKDINIEAWFTPQIPIGNGPSYYSGLPGLILELNDGTYTILCTKIVLSSNEKINLRKPKEGKKVTLKEFEVIRLKKEKEGLDKSRDFLMGAESQRSGN